jgi:hypothetical protein
MGGAVAGPPELPYSSKVYISWANSEGAVIAYAQARVSRVLVERFML